VGGLWEMKASRGRAEMAAAVHPLAAVERGMWGWPQSSGVLHAVLCPSDTCEHRPSLHAMWDWLINGKCFLNRPPQTHGLLQ